MKTIIFFVFALIVVAYATDGAMPGVQSRGFIDKLANSMVKGAYG
jgi:hypothetical protein